MVTTVKTAVFWDFTRCSPVHIYDDSAVLTVYIIKEIALMMEAVRSSET
jgi:hypothetical protein